MRVAAGDGWVQVERLQPRSGEDDDLDARGTGGRMKRRETGRMSGDPGGGRAGCKGAALISLSPPRWADQVGWEGLRSGSASHSGAFCEARDYAAPAGAKGLFVDSMCQIASDSRRARSTWATLGPR